MKKEVKEKMLKNFQGQKKYKIILDILKLCEIIINDYFF